MKISIIYLDVVYTSCQCILYIVCVKLRPSLNIHYYTIMMVHFLNDRKLCLLCYLEDIWNHCIWFCFSREGHFGHYMFGIFIVHGECWYASAQWSSLLHYRFPLRSRLRWDILVLHVWCGHSCRSACFISFFVSR